MGKKVLALVFAVVLVVMGAVSVSAAGQEGTVRILPARGGALAAGGEVTLYRVGEPVSGGFRLTGELADWIVREKDALSDSLASWLLQRWNAQGLTASVLPETGAVFPGLEEGLYLAVQTRPAAGQLPFRPFLLCLPLNGQWDVTARPKVTGDNPQTGDSFAPVLWAGAGVLSAGGLAVLAAGRKRKR